jgi:hypothetical protein
MFPEAESKVTVSMFVTGSSPSVDGDLQRDRVHTLTDRLHLDHLETTLASRDPVIAA